MVLKESRINAKTNIDVVGFVDDDRRKEICVFKG